MEQKKLNYLLQQIHDRNYENFNEFYNFYQKTIRSIANKLYASVIKKDLYNVEDLIQEIWLTLLEDIISSEIKLYEGYAFNSYLQDIINVTLAKINN